MVKWHNFYFVFDRKLVQGRSRREFSFSALWLKCPLRDAVGLAFSSFRPSTIYKAIRDMILKKLFELKRGTKIFLFGLADKIAPAKIGLEKFFLKEMTIIYSLLNSFTFPTDMALLVMNKVTVAPLNPDSFHSETLNSFFSQSIDKAKIKYQYIPNN